MRQIYHNLGYWRRMSRIFRTKNIKSLIYCQIRYFRIHPYTIISTVFYWNKSEMSNKLALLRLYIQKIEDERPQVNVSIISQPLWVIKHCRRTHLLLDTQKSKIELIEIYIQQRRLINYMGLVFLENSEYFYH